MIKTNDDRRMAVIIANMGAPDGLDDIERYLFNIFRDPYILDIPMPQKMRQAFARWLARKRTPESRSIYQQIGGHSPLLDITRRQADLLEKSLNTGRGTFTVFPAMRYGKPFIEDVWKKTKEKGFRLVVFVTLFPFYSRATNGSMVKVIADLQEAQKQDKTDVVIVDRFGAHPLFINAMSEQINAVLNEHKEIGCRDVLLSAHSVPMKRIKKGDPYQNEVEYAVAELRKKLPEHIRVHLSYQSKLGPVQWLEPLTTDKIRELASNGVKNLILYPLGFVADNSETLYEMDILYKNQARENGIENFIRVDALNTNQTFIEALKATIWEALDEKQA